VFAILRGKLTAIHTYGSRLIESGARRLRGSSFRTPHYSPDDPTTDLGLSTRVCIFDDMRLVSENLFIFPTQFGLSRLNLKCFQTQCEPKSKFLFNIGLRQANSNRGGINLELSWFNIHCYLRGSWGIFGDSSVILAQLQWWRARYLTNLVIRRIPFRFQPSDSHGSEQIDPQIRVLNYLLQ